MAIVVAPYNPWRENLAAQILGNVAQNYLQNQRSSEVSKKWGALMGLFPMEGQDQDAATINRMAEEQRKVSERDAIAHLLSKQAGAGMSGIPQTGAAEDIRYGLSGATRQAMPQLDKWQTPEGVAAEQVLLDRIANSYLPPSESEGANWNMNSYNAGMANRIPKQFTPEGVFSKAAETPNYRFRDMINALADPRFSPYAKELMAEIKNLEDLYTSRRNNNYLDMEAAKKNLIGAYQANMIMRHAQDLPTAMTALSAYYSNPAEHATSMAASNQKNFFDSVGNRMDAGSRQYAADASARATLGAANIHAGAEDRKTQAMLAEQALRRKEIQAAQDATSANIKERQNKTDDARLRETIEEDARRVVSSFRDDMLSPDEESVVADIAMNMSSVNRGAAGRADDPYALQPIPLSAKRAAKLFAKGDPESWKKLKHMSRGTMGAIDRTKLIQNLDLITIGNKYRIPSIQENRTWRDEFYNAIMGVED